MIPLGRKQVEVDPLGRSIIGKLGLDRNQVIGLEIGFDMDKGLDRGQGKGGRRINYAAALAVPAASVDLSAFAGKCVRGVEPAANSPKPH